MRRYSALFLALLTAGCDSSADAPTEPVVVTSPCGTAPPAALDRFPVSEGTTWTFDWTIQRTASAGTDQTFTNTMTWRFVTPTCQGGTRTVPFVQTSPARDDLPAGRLVQTGTEVVLTYATIDRSITRQAARAASGLGAETLPTVCTPGEPPDACDTLTLQPGRGVVGIGYTTTHRVSSTLYTDRGVLTRTD